MHSLSETVGGGPGAGSSPVPRSTESPGNRGFSFGSVASVLVRAHGNQDAGGGMASCRGFGKARDVQNQEGEDPLGFNDARERLAAKLAPVFA